MSDNLPSNLLPKSPKAVVPPTPKNFHSPSSNPEQATANAGGMPPVKTEEQINKANDPKARGFAPGAVHGT